MDLVTKQSFPPLPPPPPLHTSSASFPIIAIAVIGILATAFLLVSYYIFVIKCCLTWHRIDILRRFSLSRNRNHDDPLMGYSPAVETRGLDESVIRSIPIFNFKKKVNSGSCDLGERSFCECAVCLNEFKEDEKLRIIPNCSHVFHIDCIDIWLQNNANCPLCRNSISSTTRTLLPFDRILAPSCSPVDPIGGDEDYVVIELGSHNNSSTEEGRLINSRELISPSPRRKIEQKKKARKFNKMNSMGDECIDIRGRDEQFAIQPIRRSFSMDSSADWQLYLSIEEIVQQSSSRQVSSPIEGCSSRPRRNYLFSFGHSKGPSRSSSILPVRYLDPE